MTTYIGNGFVLEESNNGSIRNVIDVEFTIVAPESSQIMTWQPDGFDDDGQPIADVDFGVYALYFDGNRFDPSVDYVDTFFVEVNWSGGTTYVLNFYDNLNNLSAVIPIGGVQLPSLTTPSEVQNFIGSASLGTPAAGSGFGPGDQIAIADIASQPNWDSTENDRIEGTDGADRLLGGVGNDQINGFSGNDRILGGGGNDRLFGDGGRDEIDGGAGKDVISDGDGNDTVNGGGGNDTFRLGTGSDTLNGGKGKDTLIVDLENSVADDAYTLNIDLGRGTLFAEEFPNNNNDTLRNIENLDVRKTGIDVNAFGDRGRNNISTDRGNDEVSGRAGNDRISTGNGRDLLDGGDGNDKLNGGGQADTLIGGAGNDVMRGGGGNDTFVFRDGEPGNDRILDFEAGSDSLDFDAGRRSVSVEIDGNDTVLTYDDGASTVTLVGVTLTFDEIFGL